MTRHWTQEDVERFADGEETDDAAHLQECASCAGAVVATTELKRAVRKAMSVGGAPASLVRRRFPHAWWIAAAAVLAVAVLTSAIVIRARTASVLAELADMHATLLASANPVDVISTDRHTVRPWFEGRVPFNVPIPEFAQTPFRLIGGRVVYVRGAQAAYLLIGRSAHRISLFIVPTSSAPASLGKAPSTVTTTTWQRGGMTFIAVADVPPGDLEELRQAFR